jgi:hypothetical protein
MFVAKLTVARPYLPTNAGERARHRGGGGVGSYAPVRATASIPRGEGLLLGEERSPHKEKAKMRSIKLGRGLAAAAALLAVAPAGAFAAGSHHKVKGHPNAGAAKGCRVSLEAMEPLITTGESVQIKGALSCPGGIAAGAGQTVTIFEHSGGAPGFKFLGTAVTGSGDVYALPALAITVDSSFYATVNGARSATKRVKVAPKVTLKGPPGSQLFTGPHNRATFTGTVSPADVGAQVILQREGATGKEEWHAIQRGTVGPGGVFTITHKFLEAGAANLRVLVRPLPGKFTFRGISEPLEYQISQAQNPLLEINSAPAVAYQQAVSVTGVLKNGHSVPVTLLAHPRGSGPFTEVGKTTTDGSGNYTFAIAHATRNTFYKVTGGGVSSAVLYQGVSYVLGTPTVSKSTVSSGEPVTFSGTITPARAHVVYVERQDAFGSGFHVVDVGVADPSTGAYTITRRVAGSGKVLYRIRIPGDPENQGAYSAQLPIEVTAATLAPLRAVAPSVLPSEGEH